MKASVPQERTFAAWFFFAPIKGAQPPDTGLDMHISEGVLSPAVLAGGAGLAAAGCAIGLKKLDYEAIPRVAILSAAFFVASLIHVPIGPVGAHLVLNGLMGLLLGWVAVP